MMVLEEITNQLFARGSHPSGNLSKQDKLILFIVPRLLDNNYPGCYGRHQPFGNPSSISNNHKYILQNGCRKPLQC